MSLGERIMILGSAGSGKSTLAAKLGGILGIPVIHLDRLFWNPGWVETPKDEMDRRVIEAASGERWIIDGNYSRTMDFRMERADSIIFIDFGRFFCLCRVFKRRVKNRGKTRYDLGEGCPEKIDWEFFKWVWNYPSRSRKDTLEKIYGSGKAVYRLRTRKDVKNLINNAYRHGG
ncbi:MAG: AAA family ATPase [Firmicutes bacterium]|nr:AAA family ATPase [Bacillota bacterium]